MRNCNAIMITIFKTDRDRIIIIYIILLNDNKKNKFQQLILCLSYLIHGTWPHLVYCIICLIQCISQLQIHYWQAIKRILHYQRGTQIAILNLDHFYDTRLHEYFNASYDHGPEKRSTFEYVLLLHGALISWQSKV